MATAERPIPRPDPIHGYMDEQGFPWLENGERMTQAEFHARYELLPPGFQAELIGGIVYVVPSPLKLAHGRGDARVTGWLFHYSASTPGTEVQTNATTILDDQSEPQPDASLLILPSHGGQTRDGDDDYTHGAPELVVEVSNTSRSIDLGDKLRDYERCGVREYVVWNLRARQVLWMVRRDGRFEPLPPDADGLYRSRTFPGLWLDPEALLANDKARLIAALALGLADPAHAAFVAELERRRAEGQGGG